MVYSKILAATALVSVMATASFAEVEKVSKIDVTIDLGAIQNTKAADYWANLEADLENALAAKLTGRLVSEDQALTTVGGGENEETVLEGSQIFVDIREVELANAFERELNLADSVLVGQVDIKDDIDNANTDSYELSVTLESAQIVVPEGAVLILSTDTGESYQRVVDAFAEGVVSRLK